MKFPKKLLSKSRPVLSEERIHDKNYMYCRHSVPSQWKEKDEFPQFNTIGLKQSFNWSSFSIPVWTRFTDNKEYKSNHGVAGYSMFTIRNTNQYDISFKNNSWCVKHLPIDNNYSHCELMVFRELNKTQRRAIRMTLKFKCRAIIRPKQKYNRMRLPSDRLKMYIHWLYSKKLL